MEFGYIIAGFLVGLLVGLTGVGGGSLMTPILVLFFHIKPAFAVGTDLLYAAVTKSAGIFAHGKLGNIDWKIVRMLAYGSVPASILTTLNLKHMDIASDAAVDSIKFWLGIALLITSLSVLFRNQLTKLSKKEHLVSTKWAPHLTLLLGLILGFLVTLTSVGAGALGVTALLIIYPNRPITTIIGSDIAHAVPLTLVAGLGHASLGSVDWPLLGFLLAGSLPGIWVGSRLMHKTPERVIRSILSVLLAWAGSKLVFA